MPAVKTSTNLSVEMLISWMVCFVISFELRLFQKDSTCLVWSCLIDILYNVPITTIFRWNIFYIKYVKSINQQIIYLMFLKILVLKKYRFLIVWLVGIKCILICIYGNVLHSLENWWGVDKESLWSCQTKKSCWQHELSEHTAQS